MTTFMTLPAEIRKYISELSLRNDCMYKRMYDCRRPHPETKPAPGILFVSKQMFRESIRIFYSLNICCVRHESRYLTGFPGFQVRLNSLPWHDMGNQFSFDHIEAPHLGRLLITLGLHVNTPAQQCTDDRVDIDVWLKGDRLLIIAILKTGQPTNRENEYLESEAAAQSRLLGSMIEKAARIRGRELVADVPVVNYFQWW